MYNAVFYSAQSTHSTANLSPLALQLAVWELTYSAICSLRASV